MIGILGVGWRSSVFPLISRVSSGPADDVSHTRQSTSRGSGLYGGHIKICDKSASWRPNRLSAEILIGIDTALAPRECLARCLARCYIEVRLSFTDEQTSPSILTKLGMECGYLLTALAVRVGMVYKGCVETFWAFWELLRCSLCGEQVVWSTC